jgi:hypothetical protein
VVRERAGICETEKTPVSCGEIDITEGEAILVFFLPFVVTQDKEPKDAVFVC